MHKIPKHDWHPFDEELGLEVKQITNRFRKNKWAIRYSDTKEEIAVLTDEDWNLLRKGEYNLGL